jgi:hypothetical protein
MLPWRADAREEKALLDQRTRDQDIGRDDINDLGLTRAFTREKVAQLDRRLSISDAIDEHPMVTSTGVAK